MKLPSLKRMLSYLTDIQVDYRESEINGDLVVFLSKGRYQLCTANAIYSFEDRYDNFGNIFRDHINFEKLVSNQVLILGLGLGSVPITLDIIKPGHWDFTAIEIDESVCELAALYGYPKIISPINTHITDAVFFMKNCASKFGLVCLDIFIDDVIPASCKKIDFLNDIKNCLAPGGLVIANSLAFSDEHKSNSQAYYEEVFQTVFSESALVDTHLNYMLISDNKFLDSPTS